MGRKKMLVSQECTKWNRHKVSTWEEPGERGETLVVLNFMTFWFRISNKKKALEERERKRNDRKKKLKREIKFAIIIFGIEREWERMIIFK